MSISTPLPPKFFTEESPYIGLSFEVGYRRMAVMVGQAIIFTFSNMIRADVDSEVWNCFPADRILIQNRTDVNMISAFTPAYRSHFFNFTEHLLALRRANKLTNGKAPTKEDMDRIQRTILDPWNIYRRSSMYYSEMFAAQTLEVPFNSKTKLFRNGFHGKSAHDSLTTLCTTKASAKQYSLGSANRPKFRMTSSNGDIGTLVELVDYAMQHAAEKAETALRDKFYFTGEGMVLKG